MSDLWSFIRNVLTQGHAQQMDYDAGKYPGGYEEFCAHFEDAARDRVEELEAIIARRSLVLSCWSPFEGGTDGSAACNTVSAVLHGDEVRKALEWAKAWLADKRLVHAGHVSVLAAEVRRLQSELDRLRGCEIDTRRFEQAPCYLCGYNSHSYYQPSVHKCAARYHAAIDAAIKARTPK